MKRYRNRVRQMLFGGMSILLSLYIFSCCKQERLQEYPEDESGFLYVYPEDIPSLYQMALNGETDRIKRILEREPELINPPEYEESCLIGAIEANRIELVEYLLKKGADVNLQPQKTYYMTPLDCAIEKGYKEIIVLLVKYGAEINDPNFGHLFDAVKKNDVGIVHFLLNKGAKLSEEGYEIREAAENGNTEMLSLLVRYGADVNSKFNKYSNPPLCLAANSKNTEAVRFLLKKGAKVNLRGIRGLTPLHYAAGVGEKDMVELLVQKGAEINAETEDYGYGVLTPLCLAASNADMASVCYLLENGATQTRLSSPLRSAARGGSWEVFQYLLYQLPEPVSWEYIWDSALNGENPDIIRYLVETINIDVNKRIGKSKKLPLEKIADNASKTPQEAKKNKRILTYLLEKGVLPELISEGQAMKWIMEHSNPETFDLLVDKVGDETYFSHSFLEYLLERSQFHAARYVLQQNEELAWPYFIS